MSRIQKLADWAERFSDHLNPILVKETRCALKSRQFLVTFMLLLFASWLVATVGIIVSGPGIEFGSPGRYFTQTYASILVFTVLLIVPFSAYRSMQLEREQTTLELLNATALSPRSIVLGKCGVSLLQTFLFYSVIAPFVAFASLLQGFDLPTTLYLLLNIGVWSGYSSCVCIMLSTVGDSKQWSMLNIVGMLILLLIQTISGWIYVGQSMSFGAVAGTIGAGLELNLFWHFLVQLVGMGAHVYLFIMIAESRLTFEADNRSTGIRVACFINFALLVVWQTIVVFAISTLWSGVTLEPILVGHCLFLMLVGIFAVTEDEFLSRRVRRQIPNSSLKRAVMVLLLPGGSRGMMYFLGLSAMSAMVGVAAWTYGSMRLSDFTYAGYVATYFYLAIYVCAGGAIARWATEVNPLIRAPHRRFIVFLIPGLAIILTEMLVTLGARQRTSELHLLDLPNPFRTLGVLHESRTLVNEDWQGFFVLLVGAVLAVLINVPAMLRGAREVLNYQPGTAHQPALSSNTNVEPAQASMDA